MLRALSALRRDENPDNYNIDPCGIGFTKNGNLIWTNMYTVNASPPASNACVVSIDELEEFENDILAMEILVHAQLYDEKMKGRVKTGMYHSIGLFNEVENVVLRVSWWRRLATLIKPLILYGYRYVHKKRTIEKYIVRVRWLPRKKIEIIKIGVVKAKY